MLGTKLDMIGASATMYKSKGPKESMGHSDKHTRMKRDQAR